MRGAEAFLVKDGSDLVVHFLLRVQLDDALPHPILIGMLGVALHAPLQPVLAGGPGLPDDLDPDVTVPSLLIQRDLLDNKPHDLLAIRRRSAGGLPKLRQIFPERQDFLALTVRDRGRLLAPPGIVFLFDVLEAAQPFFPDALKRARDQTVLGFDRIILPPCPFGVVTRTFALQRPLPLDEAVFLFHLTQCGDRQGDAVRRQCLQKQPFNFGINAERAHLLATRATLSGLVSDAHVHRVIAVRPGIAQAHAAGTAAAADNALQQRAAFARRARPA
jgi:hypothetical protein